MLISNLARLIPLLQIGVISFIADSSRSRLIHGFQTISVSPVNRIPAHKKYHKNEGRHSTIPSFLQSTSSNDGANEAKVYDTIMRHEMKNEILKCSREFSKMQDEMVLLENAKENLQNAKTSEKKKISLLKRIKNKLQRKSSKEMSGAELDAQQELVNQEKKMRGLFGSSSFGTAMVTLGDKGEEIVDLAEQLSLFNDKNVPLSGWQGYNQVQGTDCLLDGKWKLQFTTAGDATFRKSNKRGDTNTYQEVDATNGTLTNIIEFEKGDVKGFKVVVLGEAESDSRLGLTFRKIIVQRRKKNWLLPVIGWKETSTFYLPSFRFLRAFAKLRGSAAASKAYFELKYIDKDFRMHKTGDGNWFIQSRIKE